MKLYDSIKDAVNRDRTIVPLEKRNVFVVYTLILIGTALDNVNTAAPFTLLENLQQEFNVSSSIASWVISGYALTLGSFIIVSGKISDIIGPHNLFLVGLTVMWVCSLICALIPHSSIIPLIVIRAIQGIGASTLVPSTLALAANYFSGDKAKYLPLALTGFVIALVGIFGAAVILGGAFSLTNEGYRGLFWLSFAWSLTIDILLYFLIIPIERTEEHKKLKLQNIDFVAAFLSIVGILLIILGLTEGGENWKKPKAYIPLVIGFFTFLSSLLYETFFVKRYQVKNSHRNETESWLLRVQLLYPPEIIHIPNFLTFLVTTGLYYAAFTMIHTIGIYYYNYIEGDSAIIVALKVFPLSVGLLLGALLFRQELYEKAGLKNMFILTAAVCLGGTIWLSRLNFTVNNSYWKYGLGSLFIYGYGANTFFNLYIAQVVGHTPLHLQGVVNGIYQSCSQVCLSIGAALVPSIIGNISPAKTPEEQRALHDTFQAVFYVIMAFHVITLLIFIFFIQPPSKHKPEENFVNEEAAIHNTESKEDTELACMSKEPCKVYVLDTVDSDCNIRK